jgi:hypothetical protein
LDDLCDKDWQWVWEDKTHAPNMLLPWRYHSTVHGWSALVPCSCLSRVKRHVSPHHCPSVQVTCEARQRATCEGAPCTAQVKLILTPPCTKLKLHPLLISTTLCLPLGSAI